MSKQVDERVVSMQFDNKQFEANVATSMSTLDKLKQKLNLSGASKGLENVNAAAKNCNLAPIGNAAETVGLKFNAMYTIADQALRNITNSAMVYGKKITSALTIDPIKSGFQEYETQIGAVQTILANTSHNGTNLDQVNAALDELNHYADKTIYNFTEMTRNIGTFTAAGVDLQTSVDSIKGIANLAAVSGSTSQQASTAMYQLSQALAAGKVSLMDWNSVVNAGMGGKVFQDALIRTSELLGTGAEKSIKLYGSFRESLTKGEWLTTKVLTETLKQFAGAYTEADLIQQGFSKSQAKEIAQMAVTAEDAATKVKTFTQLMDTLKEALQSGWTQTWEIIIGDFEEAKELFTGISDFLGEIINNVSNDRNAVLEGAFASGWSKFTKQINEYGIETDAFLSNVETWLDKHGNQLDPLIKKYGTLEKAIKAGAVSTDVLKIALNEITKSTVDLSKITKDLKFGSKGDDVKLAQTALKKLGYDLGEFGKNADGLDGIFGKVTKSAVEAFQTANKLKVTGVIDDETLAALKKANKSTVEIKENLDELLGSITELGGRELLIQSFKNAFKGLSNIFGEVRKAWQKVFPPKSVEERSEKIYGLIESIHEFSKTLTRSWNTDDRLRRTFEGLFAVLKMVSDLAGGALKIGFKVLGKILGAFNLDILDLTAAAGDALVKFREWVTETGPLAKGFDKVIEVIKNATTAVWGWIKRVWELPIVQKIVENLKTSFIDAFGRLKENFSDWREILSSFIERVKAMDGISLENIKTALKDFWENVVKRFFNVGDAFDNASAAIAEFKENVKEKLDAAGGALGKFRDKVVEIVDWIKEKLSSINLGNVFAIVMSAGLILFVKKIVGIMELFAKPFSSFGDFVDGFSDIGELFTKTIKSFQTKLKAEALKAIATSVLMLVGAIAILCYLPADRLWPAVGALAAVMGMITALSLAIGFIAKNTVEFAKISGFVLSLGSALLILAISLAIVANIPSEGIAQALIVVTVLVALLAGLMAASKLAGRAEQIAYLGGTIRNIAFSLLIAVVAMKMIAGMSAEDLAKGIIVISVLEALLVGLIAASKLAGKADKTSTLGGMVLQIALSLVVVAVAMRMIAGISGEDLVKSITVISILEALLVGLIAASRLAGPAEKTSTLGGMVLKIALSLIVMATALKLIASMSTEDLTKGIIVMALLEGLIVGLIAASKLAGKNAKNASQLGSMILKISVAFLILAGAMAIISLLKPEDLVKAIAAIGAVSLIFAGLIAVTKFGKASKNLNATIYSLTIAVAGIAIALAALATVDQSNLQSATACLSAMMGVFAGLIASTKFIQTQKGSFSKVLGTLAVLTVVVVALGVVIYALAQIPNPANALTASFALSALVLALSGAAVILSKFTGSFTDAVTGVFALLLMAVPLYAFVLVLQQMQGVQDAMGNVMALVVLTAALSLLLIPLCLVGAIAFANAMIIVAGILSLTLMAVPLFVFIKILEQMQGIQGAEANVKLLIDMVTVLGDLLIKLAIVGPLALIGVAAMTALTALMVAIGALAVGIGALMEKFPSLETFLDKGIPIMVKLAGAIGQMIGAFIEAIAQSLLNILVDMGFALSNFAIAIQPFCILIKRVDGNVAKGAGFLALAILAIAVSDFISAILTLGGLSLVPLGTQLSMFMLAAQPFITSLRSMSQKDVDAAMSLAGLIVALTVADVINGIKSFFGSGVDFGQFGEQLAAFGKGVYDFADSIKGLSDKTLTKVDIAASAGKKMAEMAQAIPSEGGLWQRLMGFKDLDGFGESLASFGDSLFAFSDSISTLEDNDIAQIGKAADASMKLVDLANAIPSDGGIWQRIIGFKDLSGFGEGLENLGDSLVVFSDKISDLTDDDIRLIEKAAAATSKLVDVNNAIPSENGFWQRIVGFKDLTGFSDGLKNLGGGIDVYIEKVRGITDDDIASINKSTDAIKAIVDAAEAIPSTGGWGEAIAGGKDVNAFGKGASSLARGVYDYVVTARKITDDDIEDITNSKDAVTEMASVADAVPTDADFSNVSSFGSNMKSLASYLVGYVNTVSGLDDVSIIKITYSKSAANAISEIAKEFDGINSFTLAAVSVSIGKLASTIAGLADKDFSGATAFSEALTTIGTTSIDGVIEAFNECGTIMSDTGSKMISNLISGITSMQLPLKITVRALALMAAAPFSNAASKTAFTGAGKSMVSYLINGMSSMKIRLLAVGLSLGTSTATYARMSYSSFYSAGKYLGDGLVKGINSKKTAAYNAGYALGQKAAQGEKDGQQSNSPSKLTIQAGMWLGEGLIVGMNKMGKAVYSSGHDLGENATKSMSSTISKVTDLINSDIDAQPTIRPVLDLSDIKSGAGAINGMFGMNPSVKMLANVGSISSMMNRNQNGTNDDVISAIKDLGSKLGDRSGDTYQINGVTYDDGSNITDAVKTLVRAARVERRV